MGRGKIEKFGLKTIADALDGSDVATARIAAIIFNSASLINAPFP
jgi:hypothetical protein